jgi:hypothetical protein
LLPQQRFLSHSLTGPAHWELITRGDNTRDWRARRGRGPLADTRRPAGRAAAIAAAIRTAHHSGAEVPRARPPHTWDGMQLLGAPDW